MVMRMAGISGTIDVDSLVKAELDPYKLKVTTKKQQKDLYELQQKQYREVITDVQNFYNKYISTSKNTSLGLTKNYTGLKFTSGDSAIATATANSQAVMDNYTIKVKQLASNATDTLKDSEAASGETLKMEIGTKGTTISFKAGAKGSDTVTNYNKAVSDRKAALNALKSAGTITTDQQQELDDLTNIKINASYNTFEKGVVFVANEAGSGGFILTVARTTDTLKDSAVTAGNTQTIGIGTSGTTISFTIGATGTDTVNNYNQAVSDRKTTLNDLKTAGTITTAQQEELDDLNNIVINASYDSSAQCVNFTAADPTTGSFTLKPHVKATDTALDAEIINSKGTSYRISSTQNTTYSNEVTIDGVTFKLSGTTGATGNPGDANLTGGTSVKLAGGTDVSDLKEKIVNFFNDYNTLITKLNTKLTEKRYRDYMPLTDDQRKDMGDDQF